MLNLRFEGFVFGRSIGSARTPGALMRRVYAQFRKEIDADPVEFWHRVRIVPV